MAKSKKWKDEQGIGKRVKTPPRTERQRYPNTEPASSGITLTTATGGSHTVESIYRKPGNTNFDGRSSTAFNPDMEWVTLTYHGLNTRVSITVPRSSNVRFRVDQDYNVKVVYDY